MPPSVHVHWIFWKVNEYWSSGPKFRSTSLTFAFVSLIVNASTSAPVPAPALSCGTQTSSSHCVRFSFWASALRIYGVWGPVGTTTCIG
jgi:hypothetical protein